MYELRIKDTCYQKREVEMQKPIMYEGVGSMSATCEYCDNEMDKDGCIGSLLIEGKTYKRIAFGKEEGVWADYNPERCGDCSCKLGELHHWGCDIERCPRCKGQALSCECNDGTMALVKPRKQQGTADFLQPCHETLEGDEE